MSNSEMRKLLNILNESYKISEGRYWDNAGPHQAEYDKLSNLVPPIGPTESLEAELIRAAGKIYYDLYNNGFGNNWEGPWTFLYRFGPSSIQTRLNEIRPYASGDWDSDEDDYEDYEDEYNNDSDYENGEVEESIIKEGNLGQNVYDAVEFIVDEVVKFVDSKNGKYQPLPMDMWDCE